MNVDHQVQPRLSVLTCEQIEQVHRYSLEILSQAGLRIDSARLLQVLKGSDRVRLSGNRVFIPSETVAWALESAPGTIDIFNRNGEPAFRLGESPTQFGVGVTNLYYQDPLTDKVSLFCREHMAIGTRLGQALPGYACVSTIGILRDVPAGREDLYGVLEMAANTTKPLVILVSDPGQFRPVLDLLQALFGDLASRPWVIPYFNPITPLIVNQETGDKLLDSLERGLPVIYSNYGMAGTTTPITPAGTLALLNAELLGGLILSQVARPGAPVILGSLPAFFDMKVMIDFYDPYTILLNAACAEMMAHYHIPHAGTSGSGLGWGADLPAAGQYWLNHLTACLGVTGLVPFVGGSLGSKAFSPTSVVYASDVIQQTRHFAAGFRLDDESAVLGEIAEAGPGGNFLMAESTLQNLRKAYYTSPVFPRLGLEAWQERGCPQASDFLREYTLHLIRDTIPPASHGDLIERGDHWIQSLK